MKLTENFTREEFDCNDGTEVPEDLIPNALEVARNLQVLRDYLDASLHVNSGYRTSSYNHMIGGKANSQHLLAKAADIVSHNHTPEQVADAIELLISQGKMKEGGIGLYNTFTHYDTRGVKARWDFRTGK